MEIDEAVVLLRGNGEMKKMDEKDEMKKTEVDKTKMEKKI